MINFSKYEVLIFNIVFVVSVCLFVIYWLTPDKGDFGQWLTFGERAQIFFNYFK